MVVQCPPLPPSAGEDRVGQPTFWRSISHLVLPLLFANPNLVVHLVMRQGQHDKGLADNPGNNQVAGAADHALGPSNTAPAVPKLIVDAAGDHCHARMLWILKQIHQGLFDQSLISLSSDAPNSA